MRKKQTLGMRMSKRGSERPEAHVLPGLTVRCFHVLGYMRRVVACLHCTFALQL